MRVILHGVILVFRDNKFQIMVIIKLSFDIIYIDTKIKLGGYGMLKGKVFQYAIAAAVGTAAIVAVVPTVEAKFSDVTPNTEMATAIEKLVHMEIVNGYADGTFRPNQPVTRGEFAKILSLMSVNENELEQFKASFSDVPQSHWAYPFIGYVSDTGLLTGYPDGTFGVNDTLTRGQFAKIIQTRAGVMYSMDLPFTDVPKGAWYEAGVKFLVGAGITKGTSPTTFSPEAAVTRGQLAVFLDRAGMLRPVPASTDPIGELAAFADPNKLQGEKEMQQIMAIMKGTKSYFATIDFMAPIIMPDEGEIYHDYRERTAIYGIYEDGKPYPQYVSVNHYNENGLESFRLYTNKQFVALMDEQLEGPKQLTEMVKSKYGDDALVYMYGGEISVIMFLDKANAYITFQLEQPRVMTSLPENSSTPYAFVLYPKKVGDLYDYEVEEIFPALEFTLADDEELDYVMIKYMRDGYETSSEAVYVTKNDGTMVFYPYYGDMMSQAPIERGAILEIHTTKSNYEFQFDGYKFK